MYELGSTWMFQCQNYGGPYLQTQQTILETQHNIFGTQFNFVKHNTKLSKQHKILADRLGKPRYEGMKTRRVSNMAVEMVKVGVAARTHITSDMCTPSNMAASDMCIPYPPPLQKINNYG